MLTTFTRTTTFGLGSIAVDAGQVYYLNTETGKLMRMAVDGSGQTALWDVRDALGLAVDSTAVYWLADDGIIWKLAK